MIPIRFGQVAVMNNLAREDAARCKSPNNRIFYCPDEKRAFMVTGQEDILLVDEMVNARNQTTRQKAEIANANNIIESINAGLARFLYYKTIQGQPVRNAENVRFEQALNYRPTTGEIEML